MNGMDVRMCCIDVWLRGIDVWMCCIDVWLYGVDVRLYSEGI